MSEEPVPSWASSGDLPEAAPIIRRARASGRFHTRPAPEADGVVVGRDLLKSTRRSTERKTNRERAIAGDLPDWQPMPPGELRVHRPHR